MSFTDVKIKIRERGCDLGCEWRQALEACAEDFGRFEKVSSWELDSERERSTFGARWGQTNLRATGAARDVGGGGDEEDIIKTLCISLPYVEIFNSKVIRGFVSELRSHYVFFVFRYCYVLCIYFENSMNVSHIYVWVCYKLAKIRWSVCFYKSPRSLCVSFSRTDSGFCIYYCSYGQISISCTIFRGSLSNPVVSRLLLFL